MTPPCRNVTAEVFPELDGASLRRHRAPAPLSVPERKFHRRRRAVKTIRAEVKKLQQNPYIGLPFFDLPKEYRRWPIRFDANGGYVALFRMEDECISILAVKHSQERDFRNMEDIRQKTGGDTGKRAET